MRTTTERLARAVRGSHRRTTRVEVWRGGEQLVESLPVSEGSLDVNGENAVPGELTLTVPAGVDRVWDPIHPLDPLAPYGQRLYVSTGVRYLDGTEEVVGLGWFQIRSTDPDYLAGGLSVVADSLEVVLEESKLLEPRAVVAGATYMGEVEALVGHRLPLVEDLPAGVTNRGVPADRIWEGDRLAALGQLGGAWPARFRVDDQGVLRVLPAVDRLPADALEVRHELRTGERGVVASWSAPKSREELYNAVFARGEEETADARQVNGYAYDNDPGSPTYYGGPFGERPLEWSSPLLATKAQADAAARTLLARRLRRRRTITVDMVPDPSVELDDYALVDTPNIYATGRVAAIKLPLTAEGGTMSLELDDCEELTR